MRAIKSHAKENKNQLATFITVSDPENFCYSSVDDNFRMSNWYWWLIAGLIAVFFLYILTLLLITATILHFRFRALFVTIAQFMAWAAVMVALGFNFKKRIESDGGDPATVTPPSAAVLWA